MFAHVGIHVTDLEESRRFYERALAPLGYAVAWEHGEWIGFGSGGRADFLLVRRDPVVPAVHLAFEAPDRAAIDAFHEAGLAAGGTDNGAPGLRPEYSERYYAAYVLGPDGHNVEAVTHVPEPSG